jgi:hypothetical protein
VTALLYEAHFFRTTADHRVQFGAQMQFPITGAVLVPHDVTAIDEYIQSRMPALAQLRVLETQMTRTDVYMSTLAGLMTPSAAQILNSTSAIDAILHVRPARNCDRCRLIASTSMRPEEVRQFRDLLDIQCGTLNRHLSEQELTALERWLNSPRLPR